MWISFRFLPKPSSIRPERLSILIEQSMCGIVDLMPDRFLNAQEAATELGISLATLYAYASRGMLRSEAVPGDPRARRYPREDVLRLREKKELRKDPEKAAPKALSWGAPVLESAITLVQDGRLYYRGRDAAELARTSTVEEVAALIWTGEPGE